MKRDKVEDQNSEDKTKKYWLPENVIEVEKVYLGSIVERICDTQECRYPLLALRLLIHIIIETDIDGRISISARQLSKSLGVHYDSVTKCLKYLRKIGVFSFAGK